jgi:hypothetical protein
MEDIIMISIVEKKKTTKREREEKI